MGGAQVFAEQRESISCSKCHHLFLSASVHAERTTPGDAAALRNIRVCVSRVPHSGAVRVLRQPFGGETPRWAYAGMYHGRLFQLLLKVRGGSILRPHMPEEALERWSPVQVHAPSCKTLRRQSRGYCHWHEKERLFRASGQWRGSGCLRSSRPADVV